MGFTPTEPETGTRNLVVVTGAGGHVGANLVRQLLANGARVRAVVRDDRRSVQGLDVEVLRADVLDKESLRAAFEGAQTVFHLAARICLTREGDGEMFRVNVGGTENVVAACTEANVEKLVHFSSIHALCALPKDEVVDETRALALGDAAVIGYDRAKAQAEQVVMSAAASGLHAVIVNPAAVIGPYDFKLSPTGEALLRLARGKLPALVDGGFNWVDARDVARGAIAAAERGRSGERYLLTGHWRKIGELAKLIAAITYKRPPRLIAPLWLARFGAPFMGFWSRMTGSMPLYTRETIEVLEGFRHVSRKKAETELGYVARPIEETIIDTIAWQREAGWI